MPIFEYHCPHCGKDFEKLVLSTTVVVCPKCGATNPQKKFSVFGMAGVGTGSSSSCSTCSSASCKSCK